MIDRTELMQMASRLKKATRQSEVLALCEAVEDFLSRPVTRSEVEMGNGLTYKEHMRRYMKEYRRKKARTKKSKAEDMGED